MTIMFALWGWPPGPRGTPSSRTSLDLSAGCGEEADQGVGRGRGRPPHVQLEHFPREAFDLKPVRCQTRSLTGVPGVLRQQILAESAGHGFRFGMHPQFPVNVLHVEADS